MTSRRARSTSNRSLWAVFAAIALVSGASAQTSSTPRELTPPTPPAGQAGDGAGFLEYALAIVLGGLIVGVCFLPSKRGHQD